MKNSSEKKTHSTSIRMSPLQFHEIEKNAEANKMTISTYMVHAAVHNDNKLDPATMVRIQNICNMACEIAKNDDSDQVNEMRAEVQALWSQLC